VRGPLAFAGAPEVGNCREVVVSTADRTTTSLQLPTLWTAAA
jgi:hypothetical protein